MPEPRIAACRWSVRDEISAFFFSGPVCAKSQYTLASRFCESTPSMAAARADWLYGEDTSVIEASRHRP
jgi:hypothetical protein